MRYEWNEESYVYPVVSKAGGLRFCRGKKAALKTHGVPDLIREPGKAIKLLDEPGSRARVKWEGDEKWTQYGDLA